MSRDKLLVLLLLLNLIFNVIMESRLQALRDLQNMVRSEISGIRADILKLCEQDKLVTPAVVEVGEKVGEKMEIIFTFRVREYQEESKVTFYYKKMNEAEFTPVAAEHLGGGRFAARIVEEILPSPEIIISKSSVGKGSTGVEKKVKVVEEAPDAARYVYYIAVRSGNTVRSTEEMYVNLEKAFVSPLLVRVEKGKDGVNVIVMQVDNAVSRYDIKSVSILGRGSDGSFNVDLVRRNDSFHASFQPLDWYENLRLKVTFSTGKTVVKDLPTDIFM
ncbi:MAG: hypothetical protein H0Z35_01790 [Thermoanaerobacteraceae bacterium]|nr:hypothetical protein [Thermoanaerobacteraceae bacterium]